MMDDLDRLILETLQEDGRTPFTTIAKQADVSETTIRNRYQNMVAEGIVRTVSVVDPFALGFQAPAIIFLKVEPGTLEQVAQTLMPYPEVSYLVMTLGSFDLMAEVFCHAIEDLANLVKNHIHLIPGVRSTETLIISQSYKLSYRWTPEVEVTP
jgi:Lrp/AsnC family transcriptional regulator for asnA, asnC and gidA